MLPQRPGQPLPSSLALSTLFALALVAAPAATFAAGPKTILGEPAGGYFDRTYTLDADFDEGLLFNVNHDPPGSDQLQLSKSPTPFPYVNVACSGRGTIVRIDVRTGQVLGEYWSSPSGRARNPSRTTVDLGGNVWAGNRDENAGGRGSVVKIGVVVGGTRVDAAGNPDPNGQYLKGPFDYSTAVDRNGDGLIRTSRGLGDILPWPNVTDGEGGSTALVEDAEDECILVYQRIDADFARHICVTPENNIWVSGHSGADRPFNLLRGSDGAILSTFNVGLGGYGGLIDGAGVIWSAHRDPGPMGVLRYDTKGTLSTADDSYSFLASPESYGLALDSGGNVWNSKYSLGTIAKFAPSGALVAGFPKGVGTNGCRGVAVTADDDVWVANSFGNSVSRLDNAGNLRKMIGVGVYPTGVAVDIDGKVWVTDYESNDVRRIDPAGGPDGLGAVDMTVALGPGALPYNYSDMTGAVLFSRTAPQGTWAVVADGGAAATPWGAASWNSAEPAGTSIKVTVRCADDPAALGALPFEEVENGVSFAKSGRYLEVRATLARGAGVTDSPILYDLRIRSANQPPDCSNAAPTILALWPPNHKMVAVSTLGITDPDGDPIDVQYLSVTSDEPLNAPGDGNTCPDAQITSDGQLWLRAERSGRMNGRVYVVGFRATDSRGASCEGQFSVCVPHDQGLPPNCVDDGQVHDALECAPMRVVGRDGDDGIDDRLPGALALGSVVRQGPNVLRVDVDLVSGHAATLDLIDIAGRRLSTQRVVLPAGRRVIEMATDGMLAPGVYMLQLVQGDSRVVKRVAVW